MIPKYPTPARQSGEFPLLAWLLATLALVHLGAAVPDLLAGGGGGLAAGVDAVAGLAIVAGVVWGWGQAAGSIQLTAVGLIVASALASGVRAASAGEPWFGADVVLVLLAAVALASRRHAAVAVFGAGTAWALALAVGTAVQSAEHRPQPASWLLLGLFVSVNALAAVGLRFALATMRVAHEATARLAAEQSRSDALTGASNRRGLDLLATPMIEHARRQGEAVNCLFIDLDEFHKVNERLGHDSGDQVLLRVHEVVLASIRLTDVVARWAGDQFVVVGPGTGISPLEMERRVRARLTAEPATPSEVWTGQVSIGSATLVPWDEGNLDSLLGRAESDMRLRRSLRRQSRERGGSTSRTSDSGRAERRATPGSSAKSSPSTPSSSPTGPSSPTAPPTEPPAAPAAPPATPPSA